MQEGLFFVPLGIFFSTRIYINPSVPDSQFIWYLLLNYYYSDIFVLFWWFVWMYTLASCINHYVSSRQDKFNTNFAIGQSNQFCRFLILSYSCATKAILKLSLWTFCSYIGNKKIKIEFFISDNVSKWCGSRFRKRIFSIFLKNLIASFQMAERFGDKDTTYCLTQGAFSLAKAGQFCSLHMPRDHALPILGTHMMSVNRIERLLQEKLAPLEKFIYLSI